LLLEVVLQKFAAAGIAIHHMVRIIHYYHIRMGSLISVALQRPLSFELGYTSVVRLLCHNTMHPYGHLPPNSKFPSQGKVCPLVSQRGCFSRLTRLIAPKALYSRRMSRQKDKHARKNPLLPVSIYLCGDYGFFQVSP
jgi:hypothetical protein